MKKWWFLLVLLLIVGCEEVDREVSWVEFSDDNGFSVEYPDWNLSESEDEATVLAVADMGCMAAVNKYEGSSQIMYDWLGTYMEEQGVEIVKSDEDAREIEYAAFYGMFLFYSKVKIYDCNGYAYNVLLACEESLFNESAYFQLFDSVTCDEEMKAEVDYISYTDEDFEVIIPDWDITEQADAFVLNSGFCNVYMFENDAGVSEVQNWLISTLHNYAMSNGVLEYYTDYNGTMLKSRAGFNYCNSKTHIVAYTCVESVFDEEVSSHILESLECWEPVEEFIIEEPVEEQEEVNEEVEEIEEGVVGLVLPAEYGFVDPEWIVWFINSNDFFTFILEDYNEINLVLEDDVNFNIKADLVDGKIVYIEEGLYEDGITIYVPAEDAVNILNNADNINFVNFLIFAAKVRTEPESLKQDVINKILGLS